MSVNTIYLLRHAHVDRSQDLHFSEHQLSEQGRTQAANLVPILTQLKINLIFCSPFKRAIQTIQPFSTSYFIENKISGRKLGSLAKDKVWNYLQKSWSDFHLKESGAESASECGQRMVSFINELNLTYSEKTILLVTHSNPIAFYLTTLSSKIDFDWYKEMKTPSLYLLSKDSFEIVSLSKDEFI